MHRLNKIVQQNLAASTIPPDQYANKTSSHIHHGGDLVAFCLAQIGVRCIYTLTGGHISPILVACDKHSIRVVDVRDEATAVFAAEAQSRVSDGVPNQSFVPGCAMVTAGSGLTNTITALQQALLSETPLILFGGDVPSDLRGRGALLDVNEMRIMKPFVKWEKSINSLDDIIPSIYQALEQATSGIPGPVLLTCPINVLWTRLDRREYLKLTTDRATMSSAPVTPRPADLLPKKIDAYIDYERITRKLRTAKRPVMLLGSQCVNSCFPAHELSRLVKSVELLGIPVYTQGMTRGLLGADHPLHFRHFRTRFSLKDCDLLLLVGTYCDFRIDYGRSINKTAFVIAVNMDRKKLELNSDFRPKDLMYELHPGRFIIELAEHVNKVQLATGDRLGYEEWLAQLSQREEEREMVIDKLMLRSEQNEQGQTMCPIRCCSIINAFVNSRQYADDDIYIVADAGDFAGIAAYLVKANRPAHWLDAGTWTLGCGAGYGIGIKALKPNSTVIILFGDGGVGWSLAEFDTFARHKINVIAIIGNNASWEQIYRVQYQEFSAAVGTQLQYTRYDKVVEPFGVKGICVRTAEELRPALDLAMVYSKEGFPVCINALISRSRFREMILTK